MSRLDFSLAGFDAMRRPGHLLSHALFIAASIAAVVVLGATAVGCDRQLEVVDETGVSDQDTGRSADAGRIDAHNNAPTATFRADGGEVWTATVTDEPVDWLGGDTAGRTYAARGTDLLRLDGDWQLRAFGSRGDERGPVRAIEQFDESRWVVSDGDGLLTITDEQTLVSPLSAHFRDAPPYAMPTSGADEATGAAEVPAASTVWLANSEGLFRWHERQLTRITPAADGRPGQLLWGPTVDGEPRPWVVSEKGVRSVHLGDDGEATVQTAGLDGEPTDAAVTDGGILWVASTDGRLFRRGPQGAWGRLQIDASVADVEANPAAGDVWLRSEDGEVWHLSDGELVGVPNASWGERRRVDRTGGLVVADDSGVRIHERHLRVFLRGRPDGRAIASVTPLQIEPSFPDRVERVEVQVDGEPLELDDQRQIQLVPAELGKGGHELVARAWYKGRQAPVQTSWQFSVEGFSVSWSDDVQPLSRQKCAACHGAEAATDRRPPLHTRQQWEQSFALILGLVKSGGMPRPRSEDNELSEEQIEMLERWQQAGFPE